jgi:methionyl aminopeptidase
VLYLEPIKQEDLEKIREVGKMSSEAIIYAAKMVKPGAKLLDIANSAESFLKEKGFGPAFPLNLSINDQAAHYTPSLGDEKVFSEGDLVKVDFGAEKNGFLGDGAITVDLSGKHKEMMDTAEKALDAAIGVVRHGVSVCDVGKAIAEVVEAAGYVPVKNLGGHGIKVHDLHAELFIPNYDNADFTILEENMVIAIEPFITTGKGFVTDSDICEIYSYVGEGQVRLPEARAILEYISKNNSTEPFAVRWLSNLAGSKFRLYAAIAELANAGAIEPSPTLIEVSKGNIAQAEAQMVVTKEGCEIITRAKL